MVFAASIFQQLADGRVSANLLTFYGLIVLVILAGLILRALLARGRSRLTSLKGLRWVQNIGQEAVPRLRFLVTLLSLAISVILSLAGVVYHWAGRDVRKDISDWYQDLTTGEIIHVGEALVLIVALVLGSWLAVRLIRRVRPIAQARTIRWIGTAENAEELQRWFALLQGALVALVWLLALDATSRVLGLGTSALLGLLTFFVAILAG